MRATIRDVARVAGVSDGTVSNTLNRPHLVTDETRERVHQAMEAVGYIPNASARALRVGRSRSIGLVVLDVGNPFFTDVATGAEEAAADVGADVALFDTGLGEYDREQRLLRRLTERRLDGLIITPHDVEDPLLAELEQRGTPVVILAREVSSRRRSAVRSDDDYGGVLAAEHLIGLGHRRLAYAGWRHDERYQGAARTAAAAQAQLTWLETANAEFADGLAAGARLVAIPAAERPTAIFCANDLIAVGLVQEVTRNGLRIPEDLAVVGFDDTDLASAACAVELTSVHQAAVDIGRTAVKQLIQEMSDPAVEHKDIVFTPELVVRESSTARILGRSRA
ncbi:LacI family DNA-binding transcriptional regulator [Actinoplanes sp. NPDC048796]|uniref:LacI family DNA-binding transcriptional regulator n=1 Tax=unclassified Actinoplanes TaxID=2626549 RepID=UPI0033F9C4D5